MQRMLPVQRRRPRPHRRCILLSVHSGPLLRFLMMRWNLLEHPTNIDALSSRHFRFRCLEIGTRQRDLIVVEEEVALHAHCSFDFLVLWHISISS